MQAKMSNQDRVKTEDVFESRARYTVKLWHTNKLFQRVTCAATELFDVLETLPFVSPLPSRREQG